MPGLNIPTIVKEGCLDNDVLAVLNSAFNNTTSVIATNVQTGQGFAVFNAGASVTLVPSAQAGTYRVTATIVITTTFVTNTAVTGTFGWTDDNGAETAVTTGGALTAGTQITSAQLIRVSSGAITWHPGTTGTAATAGAGVWSVVVERLI